MCYVCDDYRWGGTEVQAECSEGELSDCFGVVVKDLDTISILQFVGIDDDGMDGPILGTYGNGMDGLTDPFMDLGDMAEFI